MDGQSSWPRVYPGAPGPRSHLAGTPSASLWVLCLSGHFSPSRWLSLPFPREAFPSTCLSSPRPGRRVSPAWPSPSVCRAGHGKDQGRSARFRRAGGYKGSCLVGARRVKGRSEWKGVYAEGWSSSRLWRSRSEHALVKPRYPR